MVPLCPLVTVAEENISKVISVLIEFPPELTLQRTLGCREPPWPPRFLAKRLCRPVGCLPTSDTYEPPEPCLTRSLNVVGVAYGCG